ncbi:hypothetical protein AAHE18_02G035200 [Arachis hypogaea]
MENRVPSNADQKVLIETIFKSHNQIQTNCTSSQKHRELERALKNVKVGRELSIPGNKHRLRNDPFGFCRLNLQRLQNLILIMSMIIIRIVMAQNVSTINIR